MPKADAGQWPCHFAPSDTSGEKAVEEFYRYDDTLDLDSFAAAGIALEKPADRRTLEEFLVAIETARAKPKWQRDDFVAAVAAAVPELAHIPSHRNLDQKM
ncbi:MAG: hypothetical protein FJX42_06915 [Alphaproteobacteria bacterium]|nr:hypothetical protein [Alphaproteobacteria bacterium]